MRLTLTMVGDFALCYLIEIVCKALFADLEPKPMITRGRERREARRAEEERKRDAEAMAALEADFAKKEL